MGCGVMSRLFGTVVLPLAMVATGIGLALTRDDPMWLVFGAVMAIATSFLARRISGS